MKRTILPMDGQNITTGQRFTTGLVFFFGMVFSLFLVLIIFNSKTNQLATTCVILGVFAFVICIVSPRIGIYLLLLASGYLDLIKRFLLLFGNFGYTEIGYVLAIAPAMVAGLFISLISGVVFHRVRISKLDLGAIAFAIISVLLGFYISFRDSGVNLDAVKTTVNGTCYAFLMPVVTNLFSKPRELTRLFRFAVIVYIPVALYGIWQQYFGLTALEIDYLKSGFTITSGLLNDIHPRPFSTLNSPTSLAGTTAMMAILSLIPLYVKDGRPTGFLVWPRSILLFFLFVTACICSLSRAGNIVWIIGLLGLWLFNSKARTISFYTACIVIFGLIIGFAPFILSNLGNWDPAQNANSDFAEQALRIQTYSERLKGFINLTHSSAMWSPFGLPRSELDSDLVANHDMFSGLLIHFGVVPMSILIYLFYKGLTITHGRLLRMQKGDRRNLLTIMVSLIFGCIVVPVTSGSGFLEAFPDNLFLWLFVGAAAMLLAKKPLESDDNVSAERTNNTLFAGSAERNQLSQSPSAQFR